MEQSEVLSVNQVGQYFQMGKIVSTCLFDQDPPIQLQSLT